MRCSNCGSTVPEGSEFCNHCGAHLSADFVCPSCQSVIPADSLFCPKCGAKVPTENTISFDEQQEIEERRKQELREQERREEERREQLRREEERREQERREEARREQLRREQENRRRQQEEWRREQEERSRQQYAKKYDDDDDDDDDEGGSSNYYRNLIIGIVAVVLVIVGLLALRGCNSNNDDRKEDRKEAAEKAAQPTGQDPMAILAAELGRNNLLGDGANPAAAVMVPAEGDKLDRIWGVTYKPTNAGADKSYFKVYQLTRNGGTWNPELMHTKYLDGRNVTFDANSLNVDIEQVPRAVKINGKDYLYFAYMNNLANEGARGRVSLNLFDMDAKKLISLDYEGEIKSRDDGKLYIYGKPLDNISGPERQFLKQEADKVKILYFPTAEELKAEEEALAKAEEEKNASQQDTSSAAWSNANKEKMEAAKKGEEVVIKSPTYDNPVEGVNIKNKYKSVQNEGYIVISNKTGSVYGFNKNTRKYFTIYSPPGGTAEPTDIGFGDSKNNILRYRTADGHRFSYNLATGATKAIE